jgi:uncharacterized protein YciI
MSIWIVRLRRGGPWDWSRDMRQQTGWDDHAHFMDALVEDGFILLGGPLERGVDTFHVVQAESEQAIRERLAEDPWAANAMLCPISIERWTILLDGVGVHSVIDAASGPQTA